MFFLSDVATFAQNSSLAPKPRKRRLRRLAGETGTVAGSALSTGSTASVLGLFRPKTPKLAIGAALTGAAIGTVQGVQKVRQRRRAMITPVKKLRNKPKVY